jgi:hypothetical protein
MSTRVRRLLLTLPLAILVAGCGSSPSPSPSATAAAPAPSSAAPSAEPGSSQPSPSSAAPAVGQTEIDWGRIWDAVPAGFPRYPGSTPADDAAPEPASARFAVAGGDPAAIATWMQDALETATFSTLGLNGPAEDGSYVIDSTGEGDCRVQTTIAPLGNITFITVLYGADCPAA